MGKLENDELFGPLFIYKIKMYKYSSETVTCLEDNYQNGLIILGRGDLALDLKSKLRSSPKERCREIGLMHLTQAPSGI